MVDSIPGVHINPNRVSSDLVAGLRSDHVVRFKAREKTAMPVVLPPNDDWLIIDSTYPAQMKERHRLLLEFHNDPEWVMACMPGGDVTAAELELRDKVIHYMTSHYPMYFECHGSSITSTLTGMTVDVDRVDPKVAILLLASEDFLVMCPADKDEMGMISYPLKSGILVFPSGWSLVSKFNQAEPEQDAAMHMWHAAQHQSLKDARLGKTTAKIHEGIVGYYDKHFAKRVNVFFSRMKPDVLTWRRNWSPMLTDKLFRHADSFQPSNVEITPETWKDGFVRSEHESFLKLPKSEAIVFSIKTFVWPTRDILENQEAREALCVAYSHMMANEPEMVDYRAKSLPSFGGFLQQNAAMPSM